MARIPAGLLGDAGMTLGHLVFAGVAGAYIVVGIRLEEWDLRRQFGAVYAAYQARVPMLLPHPSRTRSTLLSVEAWPVPGTPKGADRC